MFWIIFFGLLAFLLGWILFAPLYLWIEWRETHHKLELRWWGIVQARLLEEEGEWRVQVRLLFLRKTWSLMHLLTTASRPKPSGPKPRRGKSKRWKPKHPLRLFRRLWRSFHLIRFRLQVDTDNYVLNAYLFPLFQLARTKGKLDCGVNFNGKTELLLIIENRLSRILYAFISGFLV